MAVTDAMHAHQQHADTLRAAVTGTSGVTAAPLRAASMSRAGGGEPIEEPYDAMTHQIGEAAYRVTDEQVGAVRAVAGSDKGAFEIVMAACIGAGLARWDAAARAIEEATDAPA